MGDSYRKVIRADLGTYGKLRGIYLAKKYEISCMDEFYIMSDYLTKQDLDDLQFLSGFPLFCRVDAEIGKASNLIRGKNVYLEDLNIYFAEAKMKNENSIVIFSKHPSVILTNKYIPRQKTKGGFLVTIEKYDKIRIEYVGEGFDPSEMTKGKMLHSGVYIPWELIYEKTSDIYKYCKTIPELSYQISKDEYLKTRDIRITELKECLNEENTQIPYVVPILSYDLFKELYDNYISKIIYSDEKFPDICGISANLYDREIAIIEVWEINRLIIS